MKSEQKQQTVAELKDTLGSVAALIVTDFRGLTVDEANKLRQEIKDAECQYRVVKNTLFKRAIAGTEMEGLSDLFRGPCSIAYSFNDPVAPAKVIDKFTSSVKHLTVKAGFLDGDVLDEGKVKNLASMKGKDELRADFLMLLNAPAQQFVALLAAAPQNFMYLLKAREEKINE